MLPVFLMALALYGGTVKDCTQKGSLASVLDMGISPLKPVAGDTSYLWVEFDLSDTVYNGTATYSYTYNFVPFEPTVVDLCEQTECPIYAGIQNVTGNSTFPDISGLLVVKVEWKDGDENPIWCVETTYQ